MTSKLKAALLIEENERLRSTVEKGKQRVAEAERKNKKPAAHPKGWEPGFSIEGDSGTIVTRPTPELHAPDDWADVMSIWGLDPEKFEVVGPVQFRAWDTNVGEGNIETMYYCKASIQQKSALQMGIDYSELLEGIKSFKPNKQSFDGEAAMVVCLADWQIGKALQGKELESGTEATISRILQMKADIVTRTKNLRKMGYEIGTLYVAGLGDLVEGCSNHYPNQTFTVDLNSRDQNKVARRLIRDCLIEWSKIYDDVIVTAVGGNHGEINRNSGNKAFTDDGDNNDVAVFECVAEVMAVNEEAFGHVKFLLPADELYVTLDINGTYVGFAHGHKAGGGASPQIKQKNWWRDMTFNQSALADADVLVTGHYHHFSVVDHGPKIHLQSPAMDGGSLWWNNIGGGISKDGTLTFVITGDGVLTEIQCV